MQLTVEQNGMSNKRISYSLDKCIAEFGGLHTIILLFFKNVVSFSGYAELRYKVAVIALLQSKFKVRSEKVQPVYNFSGFAFFLFFIKSKFSVCCSRGGEDTRPDLNLDSSANDVSAVTDFEGGSDDRNKAPPRNLQDVVSNLRRRKSIKYNPD